MTHPWICPHCGLERAAGDAPKLCPQCGLSPEAIPGEKDPSQTQTHTVTRFSESGTPVPRRRARRRAIPPASPAAQNEDIPAETTDLPACHIPAAAKPIHLRPMGNPSVEMQPPDADDTTTIRPSAESSADMAKRIEKIIAAARQQGNKEARRIIGKARNEARGISGKAARRRALSTLLLCLVLGAYLGWSMTTLHAANPPVVWVRTTILALLADALLLLWALRKLILFTRRRNRSS